MLYRQCSIIHQKYGTSEYSRLLEELPCLQEMYGDETLTVMAPAIDAFREVRRRVLQLYPTVEETLKTLKAAGVVIAAFTESKAFYTNYRFRKLGLDGLIDYLYSPEDHSMPDETPGTRYYEPDSYNFKKTIHHFTPEGELKPNPEILREIISDLGARADQVVYAGDNILKDVFMAQQAGVTDVHALYGASQHKPEYELLRKVTHWTPELRHTCSIRISRRSSPYSSCHDARSGCNSAAGCRTDRNLEEDRRRAAAFQRSRIAHPQLRADRHRSVPRSWWLRHQGWRHHRRLRT
jgi:phosphoglycolate phosphatase